MSVSDLMKNRHIYGDKVVLVPYARHHVPKYHAWMSDPMLQYLTASEPLSLEEEYEMQTKWVKDTNKCTFIVLDKAIFDSSRSDVDAMIGDTNLYFPDGADTLTQCEIEVMIAEEQNRGKGLGKETLLMMMRFAIDVIGVERFEAKIKYDNVQSQKLFEKLDYHLIARSDVFEETTSLFDTSNKYSLNKILSQTEHVRYKLL